MRRKPYPINVLSRARHIVIFWEQIGPTVTLSTFPTQVIQNEIAQAEAIESKIRDAELHLKTLRNERDSLYRSLWDKLKRVYAGVKANYGDDSIQYEMVGRTPLSKKKHRSRRVTIEKVVG